MSMDYEHGEMKKGVVEVTFMCLMRLLIVQRGEKAGEVSCLTKVHHGMEQVNWGEAAVWHE